jgi:hypothetical protein
MGAVAEAQQLATVGWGYKPCVDSTHLGGCVNPAPGCLNGVQFATVSYGLGDPAYAACLRDQRVINAACRSSIWGCFQEKVQ